MELDRLAILENTIEKGLETFLTVGNALKEIKDTHLWMRRYESFEEYCKQRWQISKPMAYHLIGSASVVNDLETDVLPTKPAHASKLSVIKSPELRNKAWEEVLNTERNVTGNLVETVARKYQVLENDREIGEHIGFDITSEQGYRLFRVLEKLPIYYRNAVLKFGIKSNPETLEKMYQLEAKYYGEIMDILRSGYLNSEIPLEEITVRDLDAYFKKLEWEKRQGKILEISEKQKEQYGILDGDELYRLNHQMVMIFPEQTDLRKIVETLEKKGYGSLLLVAYDRVNEPDIRLYDNVYTKPSAVNGIKPQYMLELLDRMVVK